MTQPSQLNIRPDSFILDGAVFNDDENKLESRFIKPTGIQFPSDEKVKMGMQETLERIRRCYKNSLDLIKDLKVPERVKVPEEFRQSIFNNSFLTFRQPGMRSDEDDDEDNYASAAMGEKYNEFECGYEPLSNFDEEMFEERCIKEAKDYSKLHGCSHLLTTAINKSGRLMTKVGDGDGRTSGKIGDYIAGLEICGNGSFAHTFCHSCAQEYKRPSMLREQINLSIIGGGSGARLPSDIVNIILDYLAPPFTLINNNDQKLVPTSTYIDWVKFLHVELEEDSKTWFINCNLDNPFYGCIMLLTDQNDLFITRQGVDSIKEFEQLFKKSL
jgi:hypothetical protein